MTSTSEKVRFLACEQVEMCLKGIFPETRIVPFGSSVNSFGKTNCDLDMAVMYQPGERTNSNSRLVFQSKGASGRGRLANQGKTLLSYLSFAVQNFLPGCKVDDQIFNARVPIIKYRQHFLDLDCDLSCSESGYHASSLLYLWGHTDSRVRPLVCAVRKWAKEHKLVTDERPTQNLTNFPLTLMVIFYLQHVHGILPTLEKLKEMADEKDHVTSDEGIEANFLRDINGLRYALNKSFSHESVAELSLAQLLQGFFEFYGLFDYSKMSICVINGEPMSKRRDALDVVNPLEPHLNASAFVKSETVVKFRDYCLQTSAKFHYLEALQVILTESLKT